MDVMAPTTATDDDLTVPQLDRELEQVAADLAAVTDPQVAGNLVERRLRLQRLRPVVVARQEARQRQEQAERVQATRQAFATLEADLTMEFRQRAADIDGWLDAGRGHVEAYQGTLRRLGELAALKLLPPQPGRELDLVITRDRLTLDDRLEGALAKRGIVIRPLSAIVRNDTTTTAEFVERQMRRFFDQARALLPPSANEEEPVERAVAEAGDHNAPALEEEA